MEDFFCAFCGKRREHVELMLQSPRTICICSECIELGMKIIQERRETPSSQELSEEPIG